MDQEFFDYCDREVYSDVNLFTKYKHWFLLPAVATIILLSFLEKRKNVKQKILGGRPSPARPLNFLDEPRNKWGILCVFGSVTGQIIGVVMKTFDGKFPIWAKVFMIYVLCIEACILCYPLFACMTSRHRLVGAICGLLYSIGWFSFEMFGTIQHSRCIAAFSSYKSKEEYKLCTEQHKIYVKHILTTSAQKPYEQLSLREKLKTSVLGQNPGFSFPVTVLSAVFMAFIMLYMVGLYCAMFMEIVSKTNPGIEMFIDLLTAANVIATLATFLCGIRNVCIFLKNYRSNMLSLYKGDRSFIPDTVKDRSPNVHMAQGMRFLGTSIVGTFWGTVFCYLVVFVPLALMMMVTRILHMNGKLNRLMSQFEWAIYPVCMILIFQLQTWLIGRFLIQPKISQSDKSKPLAVDNRRVYDLVAFFCIFLNASIGLFTFLKRILVGAFMGLFMIPRMDRSLLLRGYETMDKCYMNYIGMIMVDFAHNHPVMRVFCHVVKECAQVTWYARSVKNTADNPIYANASIVRMSTTKSDNTRAKRRWLLAYTLIKNPSLVSDRRHEAMIPVDLKDVEFSNSDNQNEPETSYLRAKWNSIKQCHCSYPRNLAINLIILLVLLSFAVLYAGIPLLIDDLMQEAESSALGV